MFLKTVIISFWMLVLTIYVNGNADIPIPGLFDMIVDLKTNVACYCQSDGGPLNVTGLVITQPKDCGTVCFNGVMAYNNHNTSQPTKSSNHSITFPFTGICVFYFAAIVPTNFTYNNLVYTFSGYHLQSVDLPDTATPDNFNTLTSCNSADGKPNPFYLVLPSSIFYCSDFNIGFNDLFTSYQECICQRLPTAQEFVPPGFQPENNCSVMCPLCLSAMTSAVDNSLFDVPYTVQLPDFGPCVNFLALGTDSFPSLPYALHAQWFGLIGESLPDGATAENWDDLVNCSSLATRPAPTSAPTKTCQSWATGLRSSSDSASKWMLMAILFSLVEALF